MTFLTESQLRRKSGLNETRTAQKFQRSIPLYGQTRVFLSHSHEDRDLVIGLINIWIEDGLNVYVDWQDTTMPPTTNRETAEKIKDNIASNDLLVVLATKNALTSLWVPWEIGVADQVKGPERVYIVPIVNANEVATGREYFDLYGRMELDRHGRLEIIKAGFKFLGVDARTVFNAAASNR